MSMSFSRVLPAVLSFASVFSVGSASFADTVIPSPSTGNYVRGEVGSGYHTDGSVFNNCVKVKSVKTEVISVDSQPFASPQILTSEDVSGIASDTVYVVFRANSKAQKMMEAETVSEKMISFPNPNKELVCGNEFVKSMTLGASIILSRSFNVDPANKAKLVALLKSKLTDLRSLLTFDLTGSGLQVSGAGIGLSGLGVSQELTQDMGQCFISGGQACTDFINQAYADAKALDKIYPPGRVSNLVLSAPEGAQADFGDIISYTVRPYAQ